MTIRVTRDNASYRNMVDTLDRMSASSRRTNLVQRAGIKASNIVGKEAREGVSEILAKLAGVKRSAVKPRSRAASKFQQEPAYTLDFPRAIPISAIKAKKVDRKRGTVEFRALSNRILRFAASRKRGGGGRFTLHPNPLPERILGGLVFTRRHRNPEVRAYASTLSARVADAFADEFEAALARINRSR